jgi:nucleoid-associated protein YgaU
MQKDLKIGLALGLAMVAAAVLWLSTRPSLSPKARLQQLRNTDSQQQPAEQPIVPVIAKNPVPNLGAGRRDNLNPSPAKTQTDGIGTDSENKQDKLPDSTIYEQAEKIKPQKFHIVRKEETLSRISYKYYSSAGKWPKIFEANRKTIKDPDKLIPGTKLIIPD